MSELRLVEWNMEWMNDLFMPGDEGAQFRPDDERPQHGKNSTVRQRRDHLAGVLNELAPDLAVVVEGPSRQDELQLFFNADVTGTWKVVLQATPGQSQNIGIAIRTDAGKFGDPPLKSWDTVKDKRFDPFLQDTDNDDVPEQHRFERRPLYVEVSPKDGLPFRILGLHLKSKGIFDAIEWSRWWEKAEGNRKKLLAQAGCIHDKFLEPYLTDAGTKDIPLIVCGDINDGPGMDACEKRLFGSAIESLMGSVWKPELCLASALFDSLKPKEKEKLDFSSIYTTSFRDPIFKDVYQREWIDHILYSRNAAGKWVKNAKVNQAMPDGNPVWKKYPYASDHFPISVEVHI